MNISAENSVYTTPDPNIELAQLHNLKSSAKQLFEDGNSLQSLELYSKAIALSPLDEESLAGRAEVCIKLKLFHRCFKDIDALTVINPNDSKVHYLSGFVHEQVGEYEKSLSAYLKVYLLDDKYRVETADKIKEVCHLTVKGLKDDNTIGESIDALGQFILLSKKLIQKEKYQVCLDLLKTALMVHCVEQASLSTFTQDFHYFSTKEEAFAQTSDLAKLVESGGVHFSENVNSETIHDVLLTASECCNRLGKMHAAIWFANTCLGNALVSGNFLNELTAYSKLASLHSDLNQRELSVSYLLQILATSRNRLTSDTPVEKSLRFWVSTLEKETLLKLCNLFKKLELYEDAQKFAREYFLKVDIVDHENLAKAYGILGELERLQGDYEESEKSHRTELALCLRFQDRRGIALAYGNLGKVHQVKGHCVLARECHELHLKMATALEDPYSEAIAYANLGEVVALRDNPRHALPFFEKQLRLTTVNNQREMGCQALMSLGTAYQGLKLFQHAESFLRRALIEARELKMNDEHKIKKSLIEVLMTLGKPDEALSLLFEALEYLESKFDTMRGYKIIIRHPVLDEHNRCVNDILELLVKAGRHGDALELAERSSAILLHQMLEYKAFVEGSEYDRSLVSLSLTELQKLVRDHGKMVLFYRVVTNGYMAWILEPTHDGVTFFHWHREPPGSSFRERVKENMDGFLNPRDQVASYTCDHRKLHRVLHRATSVETNDLEVKSTYPEVTSNYPEVTSNDPEVTSNYPEVTSNDPEVTSNDPEVTSNDPEVTSNDPEVTSNDPEVKSNDPEVTSNDPEVTSNDPVLNSNDPEVTSNDPVLNSNDPEVNSNDPCDFLKKLSKMFLFPIEGALNTDGLEIVVVKNSFLNLIPFADLHNSSGRVLQDLATSVQVLPCVGVLRILNSSDVSSRRQIRVLGNPELEKIPENSFAKPSNAQLEILEEELSDVSTLLEVNADVGKSATKEYFFKKFTSTSLLHLSTFGSHDDGVIALAPTPGTDPSTFSYDSWAVTLEEIVALRQGPDVVVLNSCYGCRNRFQELQTFTIALPLAFMVAGVKAVVMPTWAIPREVLLTSIREFYKHLSNGSSVANSLLKTKNHLQDCKNFQELFSWTSFNLYGCDTSVPVKEIRRHAAECSFREAQEAVAERFLFDGPNERRSRPLISECLGKTVTQLLHHHHLYPTLLPTLLDVVREAAEFLQLGMTKHSSSLPYREITLPWLAQILTARDFLTSIGFLIKSTNSQKTILVYPYWNENGCLEKVFLVLQSVLHILSYSPVLADALRVFISREEQNMVVKFQDVLKQSLSNPEAIREISKHLLLRMFLMKPSSRRLMVALGFLKKGPMLDFRNKKEDRNAIESCLNIFTVLTEFEDASDFKPHPMLAKANLNTSWMSQRATEQENKAKHVIAQRLDAIQSKCRRGMKDARMWQNDVLSTQAKLSEVRKPPKLTSDSTQKHANISLQKQTQRTQETCLPRIKKTEKEALDLTKFRGRLTKIKVESGSSPSCIRVPVTKEKQLPLIDCIMKRHESYNALYQCLNHMKTKKREEIKKLVTL